MPCYHPLSGWYAKSRNVSGKRSIVFSLEEGFKDKPVQVPCGNCIGCKLEKARQWALRCQHESLFHDRSCFVTLTYETLPAGGSLVPKDYVDFMKRLRWWYGDERVRFFQCGEYGEALSRPHHHALLFGVGFPDLRFYKDAGNARLFVSRKLEELWGHGMCVVGEATFESAGYVARYALKKVVGPGADSYYQGRVPEYLTMSRRPGIGAGYVGKYGVGVLKQDFVIVRGRKCKPPRYYDDSVAKLVPSVVKRVKSRRRAAAAASVDNSGSRLVVREVCKISQVDFLRRKFERDGNA